LRTVPGDRCNAAPSWAAVVVVGHDGGIAGYLSMLLSTGDGTRRLEVSVTLGAINPTDPRAAERLWRAFGTLLITAACGSSQPAADTTLLDNLVHIDNLSRLSLAGDSAL
jgi:hypothetical protein